MRNGNAVKILKVGSLTAGKVVTKAAKMVTVGDVAYIRELTSNLLSASCIRRKDLEVFKTNACQSEVGCVLVVETPSGSTAMKVIEGEHGLYEMLCCLQ